jgi:3-methyladenine DNA glycosylase/8-oxoguanine DNA glycosylase
MIATGAVLEAAVPTVLEQKVTSAEAHTSWARLVASWGESAPGPAGLRLPPAARRLSAEPYHAFHRFGVERRRADVIRRLAARASRVEEAARLPAAQRRGRLEAFPGVGAWTSAEVAAVAWADADAVAVGDYHLAKLVVFAFTGRRGGDDDAMLELLEPFRPHRGRVARMVMLACDRPSRRAPRAPLRDFRAW